MPHPENQHDRNHQNPGKVAQLHALWQQAGDGELLPRAFAIALAVAEGVNPSTARTQYQVWFKQSHPAVLEEQSGPGAP